MTEEIRCLAISDQDMDAGNAAVVTELFDKVVAVPGGALFLSLADSTKIPGQTL